MIFLCFILMSMGARDESNKNEDILWMLSFKNGDKKGFEKIYKKYFGRIMKYFFYYTYSKETAIDLAQEVFIKIYKGVNNYKPSADFKKYIYKIAYNTLLNEVRKPRYRATEVDFEKFLIFKSDNKQSPEKQAEQKNEMKFVIEALEKLPQNQKNAIVLTRFHDLNYEEASYILGISEKALKSLLNRARKNLIKKLKGIL